MTAVRIPQLTIILHFFSFQNHQTGGILKEPPWEKHPNYPPPWDNNADPADYREKLKETYELHKSFILADDRTDDPVQQVYNFPTDNNLDVQDLINQAQEIFEQQSSSFKLNISFGVILYNIETREFRYFKPYNSDFVFTRPISITRVEDLENLRDEIMNLDILTHILTQRPNTKFKPVLITNVRFVITSTGFNLGSSDFLPKYILKKKCILTLHKNSNGKLYHDNLCLFRCLLAHRSKIKFVRKEETFRLYRAFTTYMEGNHSNHGMEFKEDPTLFLGIGLKEIHFFELCFKVNINIFELESDGFCQAVYRTRCKFTTNDGQKNTMNLNLTGFHLSYIKNMSDYSQKYECSLCKKLFRNSSNCLRHYLKCKNASKLRFPGKFYRASQSIFDKLQDFDINVAECDKYFPWIIAFDMESVLMSIEQNCGSKTVKIQEHCPVSASVASNIEGYTAPKCFINRSPPILIKCILEYLEEIQIKCHSLAVTKWQGAIQALENLVDHWQNIVDEDKSRGNVSTLKYVKTLQQEFNIYCSQVIVLGFNSSKYDLQLIFPEFIKLFCSYESHSQFVIKKSNGYCCISNDKFKFLDISQYLAVGSSYSSFLKSYEIEENKSYFPYEWFDNHDKLNFPGLPEYESFYSAMKKCNTLNSDYEKYKKEGSVGPCPKTGAENYQDLLRIWKTKGMTTFSDFLMYYNNLDVKPFCLAVEKMFSFYQSKGIDLFKSTISIPGVARKLLFNSAQELGFHFSLFDQKNKDLYFTFNKNCAGGPSIVFHRIHAKNETKIRGGKISQSIQGYDANSLYLYAMSRPMPTGPFIRRRKENNFKPEVRDKYLYSYYWMDFFAKKEGKTVSHRLNSNKEFRIGAYLVDGIMGNIILEYNGCYFHCHLCKLTSHLHSNEKWMKERTKKIRKDAERQTFLEKQGYKVIIMKECEFLQLLQTDSELQSFVESKQSKFFLKYKSSISKEQILNSVLNEEFFGAVECDIKVPAQWQSAPPYNTSLSPYDYFQEVCPIFCNVEVPFEFFGDHMQEYVRKNKLSEKPRKVLVSGMAAEKILINSPLLKWYLEKGMIVSEIHQTIEFSKGNCFKNFVETVTKARREGDLDPNKKLLAETWKLIGNSSYGGILMNKLKHRNIKYSDNTADVLKLTNCNQFRKLENLGNEFYEVELAKSKIVLNLPVHLGFWILQNAKLRMLQFNYDFLDVFIDRNDYQHLQTDTDSAYFSLAFPSFIEAVKEDKKQFLNTKLLNQCNDLEIDVESNFLPRKCCQKHLIYDNKTPGIFKNEFAGDILIGLCSKTYVAYNESKNQTKISCKGVNKMDLSRVVNIFQDVLQNQESKEVINKGFRSMNRQMFTYSQIKTGFSYFYCKREVQADGISTKPLQMILRPIDKEDLYK